MFSSRTGKLTFRPKCCEWDILELGNGQSWSQGTCHYEINGVHQQQDQKVDFDRSQWHEWGVMVDLNGEYMKESLNWQLDGKTYLTVKCMSDDATGHECWDRCARSAFFCILNVAVGGNLVGEIGKDTIGGVGSGIQVAWVAVYKTTPQ
jgi:hypothetical protein